MNRVFWDAIAIFAPAGVRPTAGRPAPVAGSTAASDVEAEARCCPRCGRRSLRPVETAGRTNFLCVTCQRCWYPEDRYLIEVNRYACGGCADRTLCRPT